MGKRNTEKTWFEEELEIADREAKKLPRWVREAAWFEYPKEFEFDGEQEKH